jgi:hypothetical protein
MRRNRIRIAGSHAWRRAAGRAALLLIASIALAFVARAQTGPVPPLPTTAIPDDLPLDYHLWLAQGFASTLGMGNPALLDSLDAHEIAYRVDLDAVRVFVEMVSPDSTTPLPDAYFTAVGAERGDAWEGFAEGYVPADRLVELAQSLPPGSSVYLPEVFPFDDDPGAGPAPASGAFERASPAAPQAGGAPKAADVMNATAYHRAGFRGGGVKIAVLDFGFAGLTRARGLGHAPLAAHTTFVNKTPGPDTAGTYDHGTQCVATVFGIAPDAEYRLYKIDSGAALGEAVDDAIANHVGILSASINGLQDGWHDRSGPMAKAIYKAATQGIDCFVSAGNCGASHFQGTYAPAEGSPYHNFVDGTEFIAVRIPANSTAQVVMIWDSKAAPAVDYDLGLWMWTESISEWKLVDEATNRKLPFEVMHYENKLTVSVVRYLTVAKHAGGNVEFEIMGLGCTFESNLSKQSSSLPPTNGDHGGIMGVAAIDAGCYPPVPAGCPADPVEPYSGWGPSNDGTRSVWAAGPDKVAGAFDDVFDGTSCATPAVAGMEALLFSIEPTDGFLYARLRLLELGERLGDLPPAGKDLQHGYGAVLLPKVSAGADLPLPKQLVIHPGATTLLGVVLFGTSTLDVADVAHAQTRLVLGATYAPVAAVTVGDRNGDGRSDALYTFGLPDTVASGVRGLRLESRFTSKYFLMRFAGVDTIEVRPPPVAVGTPGLAPPFAIEAAYPNPAPHAIQVRVSLPDESPATLELLDLAGRILDRREVAGLGRGVHAIELGRVAHLAPGIYLVRLSHGTQTQTARVAALR